LMWMLWCGIWLTVSAFIAYFCHPLDEALLVPVPSKAVEEHAKLHGSRKAASNDGKVITARDHLMERLAATYSV